MDLPFSPTGPTVAVTNVATQIALTLMGGPQVYRIRNLSSSVQYLTWGTTNAVTTATPSSSTPAYNTLGMLGSSVEVFGNIQPWLTASSSSGFEVTPGEGV